MDFVRVLIAPEHLDLVYFSTLGVLGSAVISLVPALHVYNVIGIFLMLMLQFELVLSPMQLVALAMGMIVGYAILNTVPGTLFSPGDESMSYYVLPSAQWLAQGRSYEAIMLTGVGALGGLLVLAAGAPVLIFIMPSIKAIVTPHLFWILATIMAYMIMSEWPKGVAQNGSCWTNFFEGWWFLGVGIVTFILAGLLGFIVMSKTLVPINVAFQSITPVFVGMFAIPWLITNVINIGKIPPQHVPRSIDISPELVARGVAGGVLGGFFAACVPLVTAGIAGLMSGHATAQRDSRLFVLSYGTCKTVYYVGGFLLLFIPSISITRGGLAWIITPFVTALTIKEYLLVVALMLFSAGLAFVLLGPFTRLAIWLVRVMDFRLVSGLTLLGLIPVIGIYTGWGGLAICTVATGIGLLPVLFQARRMNLMAVLLVPVCASMSGYGNDVIRWLGLI